MRAIEKVYAQTVIFRVTRELYYGQLRATPPGSIPFSGQDRRSKSHQSGSCESELHSRSISLRIAVAAHVIFTLVLLLVSASAAPGVDVGHAAVRPGTLPKSWITGGPKCMEVPDWQVHEYNPDFYILRESGCTHFEKPFLYLLFGADKALLRGHRLRQ